MTHRLTLAPFLIPLLFLPACANMGQRTIKADLPPEDPAREAILHDLGANARALDTFRAAGSFTVSSPQLTATQRFPIGHAKFSRPDRLYVQGQKRLGPIVFKLTCVSDAYLMEIPASREDSFYQFEGDRYADVPFSVSPSDIAREMFLPESWLDLPGDHVHLIGIDEDSQSAIVEIGPREAPRRRIEVSRVQLDHPAWVVTRNARLDEYGIPIAITESTGYRDIDGVRFPEKIDAYFPTEDTRMTFDLRNIRINLQLTDADFDIEGRIRELNLKPRS